MGLTPFTPTTDVDDLQYGKLVLTGVRKILVTPYIASEGVLSLGSTTYQLDNIIADTATITQDDPNENNIDNETGDEPILKSIINGTYSVEMTSADIQKDILVNIFGYTYDEDNMYVCAPSSYPEVYAAVEFIFGNEGAEKGSLVCPKVQLMCKIDASSLKSETVKGIVRGTCVSVKPNSQADYVTPFFVKPRLEYFEIDYAELDKKPSINGVTIVGDLSLDDLGIQAALISGLTLKTLSGNSLLGSGDIDILNLVGISNFDPSKDYESGDVVVYGHAMKVFTADHAAGAWSGEDVTDADLFNYITNGTLENLVVGDLTPKSSVPQQTTSLFAIQTTGGDEDLKSGASSFMGIKGHLDDNLNPFYADTFVSTGMNLVDPTKYVYSGAHKVFYFPVKKGTWGEYGTTDENNGYVILGVNPDYVFFKPTKPTNDNTGVECEHIDYNGRRYYLPQGDGWMGILVVSGNVPSCHVAWSNKYDDVAGVFGNIVKDIYADVTRIHLWGLAALEGVERSVYDELNYLTQKGYERVDRFDLSSVIWTLVPNPSTERVDAYEFTTTVSSMAENGMWRCKWEGMTVSGNTITIVTSQYSTVSELTAALAGYMFYYELASEVEVDISDLLANTVNDFGLSYFLSNGELATIPAYVTEAFYQSGKDQLFNMVSHLAKVERIMAHTFSNLNQRIKAVSENFGDKLSDLVIVSINGKTRKISDIVGMFKLQGTESPITAGIVPDFVGEQFYDTTNKIKYEAFGVSSSEDWQPINS